MDNAAIERRDQLFSPARTEVANGRNARPSAAACSALWTPLAATCRASRPEISSSPRSNGLTARACSPDRIALASEFGATDIVSERGDEAVERVRELTDGLGPHSVLECVGLGQAVATALEIARRGGAVGRVGVPQDDTLPAGVAFWKNVSVSGGTAPARAYIDELLPDVLGGTIDPGRVFDRVTNLDGVPDGYRAMSEREAIKVMIEF